MDRWPSRIFCDTSFFFACLEPRDFNHVQAARWLEQAEREQTAFWTTWDIISETVTLLRAKSGYRPAAVFIEEIPRLELAAGDAAVQAEAVKVFRRFAADKKLSLCDCLSYVVLTTQLKGVVTATFDKHFKMLGLPILPGRQPS